MNLTKREAEFLLLALQWAEQDRDSLADANDVEGCKTMMRKAIRERNLCAKLREKVRAWLHANKGKVLLTCKTHLQENANDFKLATLAEVRAAWKACRASIKKVLATPKGKRVMSPAFGVKVGKMLDIPVSKKTLRKGNRKVRLKFSKIPLAITPKGERLLDLSPTAYGESTTGLHKEMAKVKGSVVKNSGFRVSSRSTASEDWKEMSSKDWAKVLYLRKHGHFTAKDILAESDPREAMNMPCQYPGCRTKTKQANSNYCRAHQKRSGDSQTRGWVNIIRNLDKKGAASVEKNRRKEAANLRSAQAMITGER